MGWNRILIDEKREFVKYGYIGCLAVTIGIAIAISSALNLHKWIAADDHDVINLIFISITASLCVICVTFEAYLRGGTRTPLTSLMTGIFAMPALIWIFTVQGLLPWFAIAAIAVRQVVVIYKIRNFSVIPVVISALLIGYWAFLLMYVDGYKSPWIKEEIALGTVHVDLLFHAAIVNMLSAFNAQSLGIDGLLTFPYHFGSHRVAVLICQLLSISPLQFYAIVFPLLFGPLFIMFFFFFVVSFLSFLSRTTGEVIAAEKSNYSAWFWIIFFITFVGLSPIDERRSLGVWDNVFHSESFGLAVLVSYLAGIWIFENLERIGTIQIRWYMYPTTALYLIVLCSLKISVGAVIGGVLVYAVLRLPLTIFQQCMGLLSMFCALVYGYLVTQVVTVGANTGLNLKNMIKPFAFIRDIIPPEKWPLSFFAFFGPALIFILLRIVISPLAKIKTISSIFKTVPRDIEIIIVIVLISIIPGLLLSIPQGATNFFAEVSYWWVQPMLSVVLASFFATPISYRTK